jgi:carboxymethylenebutenolidase
MHQLLKVTFIGFLIAIFVGISQGNSTVPDLSHATWMAHQQDIPIASPIVAVEPQQPVEGESVPYGRLDRKPVTGYLARPTNSEGNLPGLIVIHEWWGLNENIKMMTRRLAGEGYVALAVDLYEGEVASEPDEALELLQESQKKTRRLKQNIRQAYRYLESEQNANKIGSIGWCFGGTWSLNTALLFPRKLDAAVIYYGGGLETNPDRLKSLQMPILGIFGELDNNPSVATVRQFEAALQQLDKSAEIYVYENADHAFANPSGTRYNAEAAEQAWQRTTEFLAQYLK